MVLLSAYSRRQGHLLFLLHRLIPTHSIGQELHCISPPRYYVLPRRWYRQGLRLLWLPSAYSRRQSVVVVRLYRRVGKLLCFVSISLLRGPKSQ